ncbi:MAG: hypothetical protein AABY15_04875 [Nanoarchaeota archaeon]
MKTKEEIINKISDLVDEAAREKVTNMDKAIVLLQQTKMLYWVLGVE